MKRFIRLAPPWLLAAALVGMAAWGWHEHLALMRLQAAGLTSRVRSDLQSRLWTLEKQNHGLEAELAALRHKVGPSADREETVAAAGAAFRSGPKQRAASTLSPFQHALLTVLQDPQLRELWMAGQKDHLDQTYGDLFKKLNLPPGAAAKFRSLLLDKQVALFDALGAIQEQGLTGTDAGTAVHQLLRQTQKQINGSIRDLLGAADYRQYRLYQRTVPQRSEVAQLQIQLQQSGAQLQTYQSNQLVGILSQDATSQLRAARATGNAVTRVSVPGDTLTGIISTVPISNHAVAAASGVLTPVQLQALQQLQQQQQAQQIIRQLVRQARRATSPHAGG